MPAHGRTAAWGGRERADNARTAPAEPGVDGLMDPELEHGGAARRVRTALFAWTCLLMAIGCVTGSLIAVLSAEEDASALRGPIRPGEVTSAH